MSRRSGLTIDCTTKMLATQQLSDQVSPSLGVRGVLDYINSFSCTVGVLLSAWLMCCPSIYFKNNMGGAIAAACSID